MNRRKFLAVLGGGVILAAGAGAYRVTRKPQTAAKPWSLAGSAYEEPRRKALSYAILAPNPHNRQPWLVDLSKSDEITLLCDIDRMLPHTDPYNRQITIGLGCFLELLTMAAAEDGFATKIVLFPKGSDDKKLDKRPVATIKFEKNKDVSKDPLFAQVLTRRSLKEPFDIAKPVSDATITAIQAVSQNNTRVDATNATKRVGELRKLTEDASLIEMHTPRTHQESVDLFRIGYKEVDANPDGIDLSGTFLETLALVGQLDRESMADQNSNQFAQGKDVILEPSRTAMAHMWMATSGNTREDQINAGRDWVRLNLAATKAGVGFHPMSQCLQEFPEMKELYDKAHKLLAKDGETVQMLVRLGYAAPVGPSPRWPLEAKILNT